MRAHADALRLISDRLGLPTLRDEIKRPGVNEAWRLTIRFGADSERADQVATLTIWHAASVLEVVYRAPSTAIRAKHILPMERYRPFARRMLELGFDRMDDQPGINPTSEIWLIERVAAHYHHDLVVSPPGASGPHAEIVDCFRKHLPEAISPQPEGDRTA